MHKQISTHLIISVWLVVLAVELVGMDTYPPAPYGDVFKHVSRPTGSGCQAPASCCEEYFTKQVKPLYQELAAIKNELKVLKPQLTDLQVDHDKLLVELIKRKQEIATIKTDFRDQLTALQKEHEKSLSELLSRIAALHCIIEDLPSQNQGLRQVLQANQRSSQIVHLQ